MAVPVDNCKAQAAVEQVIRKWEMAGDTSNCLYIENSRCDTLLAIPYIPSNVQKLTIHCRTKRLPLLPQCLKVLQINIQNTLEEMPRLPTGLIELEWYGDSKQYSLIEFPRSLRKLSGGIANNPSYYKLIPPNIVELDVYLMESILPVNFPPNVEVLNLYIYNYSAESNATFICPSLPHGLSKLRYESDFDIFPELPESLKVLEIKINSNSHKPLTLPELPDSLEILIVNDIFIKELPCSLPSSLKILKCSNTGLRRLPALPRGLQELRCDSTCLTYLPVLPSTLKYLNCSECKLLCLPPLPPSLEDLTCIGCQLEYLPRLPASLKTLTCVYNNIKQFPDYHPNLDVCDDNTQNM